MKYFILILILLSALFFSFTGLYYTIAKDFLTSGIMWNISTGILWIYVIFANILKLREIK